MVLYGICYENTCSLLISSCHFGLLLRRDWLFLTNTAGNTRSFHPNLWEQEPHRQCPILKIKMSNLDFHTDFTEVIAHQHLHLLNFTVSTITKLQVSRYFFPIGLPWMLLFIINQAHSFWIKGSLVHLYYAINTYSKNKIPHRPQSENYEMHFFENFWNWHITVYRICLTTKKHSMMQMKSTGKWYIWI